MSADLQRNQPVLCRTLAQYICPLVYYNVIEVLARRRVFDQILSGWYFSPDLRWLLEHETPLPQMHWLIPGN